MLERAQRLQERQTDPRIHETPTQSDELDLDQPPRPDQVQIDYISPKREDFEIPPALDHEHDPATVMQKHLPKQVQLDKVIKQLEKKVLRNTHLPYTLKALKAHYLRSPHFKDIYIYLQDGTCPQNKAKADQLMNLARWHFLLDGKLFKLSPDSENAVLCIPTTLVDTLLYMYHTSKLGAHVGVTKCLETLRQRFYCPDLARHVRAYIMGCHVCQMFKYEKNKKISMQQRVTIDTPALTRFSMDIKHMPPGVQNFAYILVMLCEVSNYMIAVPLRSTRTPEVCEAILKNCIAYFGPPSHIICDQDPAFMSTLATYFFAQHNIKIWTVGPTNHRSLKAEAGIKALSSLLMKHLTDLGRMWPHYVALATMSYNCFSSPNLIGYSPIELSLGRRPRIIPELEQPVDTQVSIGFQDYLKTLKDKLAYMRKSVQKFRLERTERWNKDREELIFTPGQLVYLYYPAGSNPPNSVQEN